MSKARKKGFIKHLKNIFCCLHSVSDDEVYEPGCCVPSSVKSHETSPVASHEETEVASLEAKSEANHEMGPEASREVDAVDNREMSLVASQEWTEMASLEASTVENWIAKHLQFGKQEDVHEFFCCIVEALHLSCPINHHKPEEHVEKTSVVHQIFTGQLRSTVECTQCSSTSDRFENCLDISLHINVQLQGEGHEEDEPSSPERLGPLHQAI
ncbi:unnamed protein product [Lampetra planeri]